MLGGTRRPLTQRDREEFKEKEEAQNRHHAFTRDQMAARSRERQTEKSIAELASSFGGSGGTRHPVFDLTSEGGTFGGIGNQYYPQPPPGAKQKKEAAPHPSATVASTLPKNATPELVKAAMGTAYYGGNGQGLPRGLPKGHDPLREGAVMEDAQTLRNRGNGVWKDKTYNSSETFNPRAWRYTPERERVEKQVDENLMKTMTHPKYMDPGANMRNGVAGYVGGAGVYNLRERQIGQEVTTEPMRFRGFKDEAERIKFEQERNAPMTLGDPEGVANADTILDRTVDPSKWVGGKFSTRVPAVGRLFKDEMKKRDFDPYADKVHVSVSTANEFRTREPELELKTAKGFGFSPAVPSGKLFGDP